MRGAFLTLLGPPDIVADLNALLGEALRLNPSRLPTHSGANVPKDPYSLWNEGDNLTISFAPGDLSAAVPLFKRAIELDPGFAAPIAGLATVELSLPMAVPAEGDYSARIERGLALAKQAVALDPWDGRARNVLAWALMRTRAMPLAKREFERALSLAPNDPQVLVAATEGLALLGDPAAGIQHGETALKTHPAPPDYYRFSLSIAYQTVGAFDRALELNQAASTPIPEQLALRAICYKRLGRKGEAAETARRFLSDVQRLWAGTSPPRPDAALRWLYGISLIREPERLLLVNELAAYLGAAAIVPHAV